MAWIFFIRGNVTTSQISRTDIAIYWCCLGEQNGRKRPILQICGRVDLGAAHRQIFIVHNQPISHPVRQYLVWMVIPFIRSASLVTLCLLTRIRGFIHTPRTMECQRGQNPIIMEIHNWIMDLHNYGLFMDLHNWIMDLHNWMMSLHNWIMDLHNWIMDLHNWIMSLYNWIMEIHIWIMEIHNWIMA